MVFVIAASSNALDAVAAVVRRSANALQISCWGIWYDVQPVRICSAKVTPRGADPSTLTRCFDEKIISPCLRSWKQHLSDCYEVQTLWTHPKIKTRKKTCPKSLAMVAAVLSVSLRTPLMLGGVAFGAAVLAGLFGKLQIRKGVETVTLTFGKPLCLERRLDNSPMRVYEAWMELYEPTRQCTKARHAHARKTSGQLSPILCQTPRFSTARVYSVFCDGAETTAVVLLMNERMLSLGGESSMLAIPAFLSAEPMPSRT